jgi:hypothetical protein
MPSSYTSSLRLEKQATGENLNTWGERLNLTGLDRIDFSIAGWTTISLTSSRALTSSNTATDEARSAMLKFTGAGGFVVTLPSVSKAYMVWNASSAAITLTTGAGDTLQIDANDILVVICDGTNVKTLGFNNQSIKDYIQAVAWASSTALPAQLGNAGKFVKTDGTDASWQTIQTTDIGDWQTRRDELVDEAVAFAVAL